MREMFTNCCDIDLTTSTGRSISYQAVELDSLPRKASRKP